MTIQRSAAPSPPCRLPRECRRPGGQGAIHVILRGGVEICLQPFNGQIGGVRAERSEAVLEAMRAESPHCDGEKTPDRSNSQPDACVHDFIFLDLRNSYVTDVLSLYDPQVTAPE